MRQGGVALLTEPSLLAACCRVAAGLPGALAAVGRIRGFVVAALKDAATACSASIAPRLLTLAHELMAYLDAPGCR